MNSYDFTMSGNLFRFNAELAFLFDDFTGSDYYGKNWVTLSLRQILFVRLDL